MYSYFFIRYTKTRRPSSSSSHGFFFLFFGETFFFLIFFSRQFLFPRTFSRARRARAYLCYDTHNDLRRAPYSFGYRFLLGGVFCVFFLCFVLYGKFTRALNAVSFCFLFPARKTRTGPTRNSIRGMVAVPSSRANTVGLSNFFSYKKYRTVFNGRENDEGDSSRPAPLPGKYF